MGDKKSDMDRIGVFQEMGYVTIKDPYKAPGSVQFNAAASKNKQMLPGGSKTKSALPLGSGYFQGFSRMMEGEAYSDPIKIRRQHRLKEGKKNIGKAFLPSSGEKKMSGLGNHYGTLAGPIGAFSPAAKPGKEYKSPGKNVITNPGKRGTGFGYVHITLGDYPKYQVDPYDRARELTKKELQLHKSALKGDAFKLNMHPKAYFDGNPYSSNKVPARRGSGGLPSKKDDVKPFKPSSPGKKPGGAKIGTFDAYPSHSADPYKIKFPRTINVVNKSGKIFVPSQGPKSVPTTSIVDQNVMRTINIQNYRSVTSVF